VTSCHSVVSSRVSWVEDTNERRGDVMKVFITGTTGAIGRQLVPMLVEGGHEVVAMTRSPEKAKVLRATGAEPVI
jgi:NADPH:quinone reductase-like Zn-dependent oxidoreductase